MYDEYVVCDFLLKEIRYVFASKVNSSSDTVVVLYIYIQHKVKMGSSSFGQVSCLKWYQTGRILSPIRFTIYIDDLCSLFRTSVSAVSGSLTLLEPSVMLTTWHFLHHRLQHFD